MSGYLNARRSGLLEMGPGGAAMARRAWWVVLVLLVWILVAAGTVSAQSPTRKIIMFRDGVDEAAKGEVVRQFGGKPLKQLGLVNATVAEISQASTSALVGSQMVVGIEDDIRLREDVVGNPPVLSPDRRQGGGKGGPGQSGEATPWGVEQIRAPEAWRFSEGGVKVAILDSGIDLSHPDLKVAGGVNEIEPGKSYNDDRGHGTHVAGIVAALANGRGIVGVAPDARLYAVKVIDKNGEVWVSDVIDGLQWSVTNGMRVANMSFGSSQDSRALRRAVTRAYSAGLLMVASAGNAGPAPNSVHYPAAYPEVLAVSALDRSDHIAPWSSVDPQIALAAPGVDIYSTYLGGGYATLSGTSMAAPHVTGVAALRLRLHPDESPADVAEALKKSADRLPGLTCDQQGAGRVDALGAVTRR